MIKERILSWEEFRYLNGVRRNNQAVIRKYDEYLKGLMDLGIVAINGKIEKQIKKLTLDMENLNVSLSALVEKERAKDIALYLEDL